MQNKEEIQATYNVKYPIEILFNQIEKVQQFTVAGNSPFYDRQLTEMGVTKILATQKYTHTYRAWKSIAADNRTWVNPKAHFQTANLEREYTKQTANASGYGNSNNVNNEKWSMPS